jgi:hypothetical protein
MNDEERNSNDETKTWQLAISAEHRMDIRCLLSLFRPWNFVLQISKISVHRARWKPFDHGSSFSRLFYLTGCPGGEPLGSLLRNFFQPWIIHANGVSAITIIHSAALLR